MRLRQQTTAAATGCRLRQVPVETVIVARNIGAAPVALTGRLQVTERDGKVVGVDVVLGSVSGSFSGAWNLGDAGGREHGDPDIAPLAADGLKRMK
jgi:hypothetical protein